MPKTLKTPKFKNEHEEADWWDSAEGRAAILNGLQQAGKSGTLKKRAGETPTTTIRLNPTDIELARAC